MAEHDKRAARSMNQLIVCYSREEVKQLIKEVEQTTETRFVVLSVDKRFNDDKWEPSQTQSKIFFEKKNDVKPLGLPGKCPSITFDGTPFTFIGSWYLECHQGKDRAQKTKERYAQKSRDRVFKKRRVLVQDTKKIGCPARLTITRIAKFPDHKIVKDSKWSRTCAAQSLKTALSSDKKVAWQDIFYVYLPSVEDHRGHPVLIGEVQSTSAALNDLLIPVPEFDQKNILQFNSIQSTFAMSNWLQNPIKGVLLDITGVLYESGEGLGTVIPGSVNAVKRLKEAGIPVRLVTNETCDTRTAVVTKLQSHGYDVCEADIFSPVPAILAVLKELGLSPHLLVHPNIEKEFSSLIKEKPTCVVIGDADVSFSFANMNSAFTALMEMEKPRLFSLGYGKYYKHKGHLQLDVGAFANALEFACDIKSEIVGKPSPHFFGAALQDMGVPADKAVMIGDDIVSDVGGSQKCGLRGVLVRTGKYTPACETHPSVTPDFIANHLSEATEMIINAQKGMESKQHILE